MKRIYITAIPLQSNFTVTSHEVQAANFKLNTTVKTSAYSIVPVLQSTMQEGDTAKIIAVRQQNSEANINYNIFCDEVAALHLASCEIVDVIVPETQEKNALLTLFSALLVETEDDACYYACMTFGTKTYPLVLFSVLSYVEKIKNNTEIKGIYYTEIRRENGQTKDSRIYDVTALFTLNSIVDLVANMDAVDKEKTIQALLHQ